MLVFVAQWLLWLGLLVTLELPVPVSAEPLEPALKWRELRRTWEEEEWGLAQAVAGA